MSEIIGDFITVFAAWVTAGWLLRRQLPQTLDNWLGVVAIATLVTFLKFLLTST